MKRTIIINFSGSRKLDSGKFSEVFQYVFVIPSKTHYIAESSGSLVASQEMLNVDAKELSNLSSLFISLSLLFRCSQQTLRFSAPMLAEVKAPIINKLIAT